MFTAIQNSLKGSKTFGLCALGLGFIGAYQLGWISIPQDQLNQIINTVLFAAVGALRAGIK